MRHIVGRLVHLPRNVKQAIFVAIDCIALPLAFWIALVLRRGVIFPPGAWHLWWLFILIPLLSVPIFFYFGLYRAVLHYIGLRFLFLVFCAVSMAAAAVDAVARLSFLDVTHATVIIFWLLSLLFVTGSRMIVRLLFDRFLSDSESRQQVAVYGAGSAGVQLAKAMQMGKSHRPCFFVDDDASLHNSVIHGIRIYSPERLPELIQKYQISLILLAIPSLTLDRRRQIVEYLEKLPVDIKSLPGVTSLISGKVSLSDVQEIDIEDLLRRDPVVPEERLLALCITDKSVMVTGAGGSIGSELCRQILLLKPRRLVLYELSEFALYKMEQEFAHYQGTIEIVPLLGSVLDGHYLEMVMTKFQIQTVYHAAAYKHVPLVEINQAAGVNNNVFGTYHAAIAARNVGVNWFILISTDKAVRPTNVMGASKRVAELVLQGLTSREHPTKFIIVRFGNVLGSSGSVVPLFRAQILRGGPVTVTHPDVTRYFMTIPEAAQLVLQAGAMGHGGDVFLLDMGKPIRIADMARHMIRLHGLRVRDAGDPEGDIAICYSGLRPGEKLYEELLIGKESTKTEHPRILRAEEEGLPWSALEQLLHRMTEACDAHDEAAIRVILSEVVTGYLPPERAPHTSAGS